MRHWPVGHDFESPANDCDHHLHVVGVVVVVHTDVGMSGRVNARQDELPFRCGAELGLPGG